MGSVIGGMVTVLVTIYEEEHTETCSFPRFLRTLIKGFESRLSLGKDEHTLIFFYARGFDPAPRVRSSLRSGRRKAEVHRTSCAPSVALGYKNRKSI